MHIEYWLRQNQILINMNGVYQLINMLPCNIINVYEILYNLCSYHYGDKVDYIKTLYSLKGFILSL